MVLTLVTLNAVAKCDLIIVIQRPELVQNPLVVDKCAMCTVAILYTNLL
jgi:hypothetical protein